MIYLYVLLLRIVAYLDGIPKIISFLLVFGLMTYSTLKRLPNLNLSKISRYNYYAIIISTLILFHGFIFGNVLLRDVAVLFTYWIWMIFTLNHFKSKSIDHCLKFVLISFFIFNLANYLYFKLYFGDQKLGINSIMSIFGVFGYRIYFPLSSGANIFTSQLALNSLIVLHFIKISRNKILYILMLGFYLMMLVLADSRLLLFFAVMFSFLYLFSINEIITFFKKFWWAIGILLFAFLFVFYKTNLFDNFKRAGELQGRSLSRVEIWGMAKDVIFSDYHFLFGHGLNGFQNNMPDYAKKIFENQHLQTSHNFIIQNIIDFGLIGIIIILFLIFEILKIVTALKSNIIRILIVMILLMGITESIPSFYSFEPTIFFIAILSIILTQHERKINNNTENNNVLS